MSDLITRPAAYDTLTEYYHHTTETQHTALAEALSKVPEAWQEEFEWCTGCKEYDQERHCCHRFTKTIRDTVEEIKAWGNWTPCSERFPEEDTNVLVTVYFSGFKQTSPNGWTDRIKPSYYVDIASQIDGIWVSASDEYKVAASRHKVVAWMPLPEPYKGEE